MLNEQLHRGADHEDGVKFAAVYELDGVPVGVTVITRYGDIQVFVRKSLRRKGIGSALIDYARKNADESYVKRMDAGTGLLSGSREFWRANNVRMYD